MIVNRARADDDQQAVIRAVQDAVDVVARGNDVVRGAVGRSQFRQDAGRRNDFLDFLDANIVRGRFVRSIHGAFHWRHWPRKLKGKHFTASVR